MFECSKERMEDKITTFAQFGATGNGGITRYTLSPAANQAREEFVKRMEAIGAEIEMDDLANMYATLPGTDPNAKRIVMGSHVDSVKNGGNYDGILGVMTAMEVLETVAAHDIPHKHPLTAMIWTNEEGSLYPPAMMVSGIICDKFDEEKMMKSKSVIDGETTFGDALKASKFTGPKENRLSPDKYAAMFETHVEQGPILENAKNEVGVVTCVAGMVNYRLRTFGQSDHAGTIPMKYRQDALFAASKLILHLHNELDKLDPTLVYTTGEIECHPNVHTVIPDLIDFSIDSRHVDPEVIKQVVEVIKDIPEEIEGCKTEYELAWKRDTVYFDKELVEFVKDSADELGYSNQYINSGAGHDAQFVSEMMPTTMIFAPSKDGHSHCEEEFTTVEECTKAASVMLNAVLKTDEKYA
jgi:N-carbamoyl-L-amino-acid hydrolase